MAPSNRDVRFYHSRMIQKRTLSGGILHVGLRPEAEFVVEVGADQFAQWLNIAS
jgi:hypothetical protein